MRFGGVLCLMFIMIEEQKDTHTNKKKINKYTTYTEYCGKCVYLLYLIRCLDKIDPVKILIREIIGFIDKITVSILERN